MSRQGGKRKFSFIEFLVLGAMLSVVLTFTAPAYKDFSVRTKVSEGVEAAEAIKSKLSSFCENHPGAIANPEELYREALAATEYLQAMGKDIEPDCSHPVLFFQTSNTGAEVEVGIVMVGHAGGETLKWVCYLSMGESRHVPESCRRPIPYEQDAIFPAG